MEQIKLDRINELAKKSRETNLLEDELLEQQLLRGEYIEAYRASLKNTLDNVVLVDENGIKTKAKPKRN